MWTLHRAHLFGLVFLFVGVIIFLFTLFARAFLGLVIDGIVGIVKERQMVRGLRGSAGRKVVRVWTMRTRFCWRMKGLLGRPTRAGMALRHSSQGGGWRFFPTSILFLVSVRSSWRLGLRLQVVGLSRCLARSFSKVATLGGLSWSVNGGS